MIDRRKLRKLDLQLLAEIVEQFSEKTNDATKHPIVAMIKGLSVGDEFEFLVGKASWHREFVVEFIERFVPQESIARESINRRGFDHASIVVPELRKGRESTPYGYRRNEH